jgi:membrane-associated phospholipid phosphatase
LLQRLDNSILRALRLYGHPPNIEQSLIRVSRLGEHGALWLVLASAGAILDRPRRPVFARALVSILIAYAANQLIKFTVRRPRPQIGEQLISTGSRLSYPSAHAATSFAGARSLSRVWPAKPLYALAGLIAFTRPYLGVHYPSDVVAGAALGSAVGELCAA